MIFFKGTRSIEPPAERRQLRRVPRVLASSFRLVWEAAPRRFMVSLAPQAVSAVIVGAQLVITRDLIAAVLATGSGGDVGRVVLLLIAVIGFVPMWLASMATSRTMYRFSRSMTPNERMRNYVFNLFTQREYAKEIRAFGLAGYLRALYERLSNERLEELRKNLRKRARYQALSSGASALVTALTYGALAYLVIGHRIGVAEAGAAVVASQQLNGQLNGIVQNAQQLYEASLFLEDWEEFSALAPSAGRIELPPATPFSAIEVDH